MAGAFVDFGVVGFAGVFHEFFGLGDGGVDAGVVAAVEAVDGDVDAGDGGGVVGAGAVEDECGFDLVVIGCEAEGLGAAPAVAGDGDLAVGGGEGGDVVDDGVQVGGDLVGGRLEMARRMASPEPRSLVPPPSGAMPERRSGAMAM